MLIDPIPRACRLIALFDTKPNEALVLPYYYTYGSLVRDAESLESTLTNMANEYNDKNKNATDAIEALRKLDGGKVKASFDEDICGWHFEERKLTLHDVIVLDGAKNYAEWSECRTSPVRRVPGYLAQVSHQIHGQPL